MHLTVAIYQRKREGTYEWTTVGLGPFTRSRRGTNPKKLEEQLRDDLRKAVETCRPHELATFDLKKGTHLRRARVEVNANVEGRKKKLTGPVPVVIEPRAAASDRTIHVCYHPERPAEWFVLDPLFGQDEQIQTFFQHAWSNLDGDTVEALFTDGKDLLRAIGFSARPRTLLDEVAAKKRGLWDDLENDPAQKDRRRGGMRVLSNIGVDRSARRSGDGEGLGLARAPYREQLQMLLGNASRRSLIVVGPPGCGKSTIIERFIDDLLALEDYPSHRNHEKVTHVWEISGKRIIAGMSYVGDWEQRVTDLIEDVRDKKIILYVPDIAAFGRIGQARDSKRALADVLRTPVARGEVVILGEATEEQLARLEQDAPAFAALFSRVHVREAGVEETFRMLLAAAREAESERDVTFEPFALRTLQELGGSLVAHRAMPGKVLELFARMTGRGHTLKTKEVGPNEVIEFLAQLTGLPSRLLEKTKPVERHEVEEELSARVMGQPDAVRIAADLVLKIRSGVCDPRRPYGVLLFTGPTGTGKTELAKALAGALYGSEERLLRFDMGELGAPDAASRLVGDAWQPDGVLTRAIREQPFSVVLFDEVEKAHPSVLNLFLQLFEDGRLTDAAGNLATFHHAVIVMTANLGARAQTAIGFDAPLGEQERVRANVAADVAKAVREFFPPELFNRIDRVVSFAPLAHDVAIDVAEKELGKLLSRRGLASRQIFVRANRAVVESVAAEAFRQTDGARSLKRFLEDRIGTLIGEQIARSPAAALRVLHLSAHGDRTFHVEQEALVEATPIATRSRIEGLLDLPTEELAPHVHALLPRLDALEPDLSRVADAIRAHLGKPGRADAVFHLDALRTRVRALRDRLELVLVASRDLDREALERKHFAHDVFETGRGWDWQRRRLRVLAEAPMDERSATRRELLSLIAEAWFLERALSRADDPGRHSMLLELLPFGEWSAAKGGLLLPMFDTYVAAMRPPGLPPRGEIEAWAILPADGERVETGHGEASLRAALQKQTLVQVAMRVVGPCIVDVFEEETGTHVLEGHAIPPSLLRVRTLQGDGDAHDPRAFAEAHLAARVAFDRATADRHVARPDALLPIVRRIRREDRDPPRPGHQPPTRLTIEDYRIAWSDTVVVRDIEAALSPIFLMRLSREA